MKEFTFNEEKHEFKVDGNIWPSITQVLVSAGFIDTRWFDERSATRGTYVHQMAQWDVEGTLDESSIDSELIGYYQAWKKFRKEMNYEILEMEIPRINDTYKFAGIPDIMGRIDKTFSVIDIKTGVDQPATRLQTAAQCLLYEDPQIHHRYSLQLKNDGNYKLNSYPTYSNTKDRNVFLSALFCWWWRNENNKLGGTDERS